MSNEITLPSGATVKLRDPKSFKQKDRRKLYAGMDATATLEGGVTLIDNAIALVVESWSFDLLPPSVNVESLGELDFVDYDALQEKAQEALDLMFPKLSKPGDGVVDPKATTPDSNA